MAATEQAFAAPAGYFAGGRIIQSPFQFVADQDTFFRVTSACSVAGVTLAVQGRRLDATGQLQAITETHAPLSTRTVKTQDYGLGAGAVLNLTVFASAGAPLVGQCYVMVQLLRNFGGAAIVLGTLLAGYVTAHQALGFPGSPIVSSTAGEPAIRIIIGTDPGLGAEFSETCPTSARWELISIYGTLDTDATLGNRQFGLEFTMPGPTVWGFYEPGINVAPNTAQGVQWGLGLAVFGAPVPLQFEYIVLPRAIYMLAGDTFKSFTAGLDAGDHWVAPVYQVREWLEVA